MTLRDMRSPCQRGVNCVSCATVALGLRWFSQVDEDWIRIEVLIGKTGTSVTIIVKYSGSCRRLYSFIIGMLYSASRYRI